MGGWKFIGNFLEKGNYKNTNAKFLVQAVNLSNNLQLIWFFYQIFKKKEKRGYNLTYKDATLNLSYAHGFGADKTL